jgi:phosphatidylinositol alpha-1,6-mannosyltransferase
VTHLLVTNDFPPKLGGIQSYLWELWRRLPTDQFEVLTTPHQCATAWDAQQAFTVRRTAQPVLLPRPRLARVIDARASAMGASLVVLDPALPLGALGRWLRHPYAVVLHGAEVTVPGRLPGLRLLLGRTLTGARLVVAAGRYAAEEAARAAGAGMPPTVVVPPGVDTHRFRPIRPGDRSAVRRRFGLAVDRPLVLGLSRLVPRKGFDVVMAACQRLVATGRPLTLAIGGTGRDRPRLERLAGHGSVPVQFLGRVDDADLPALYACADVFAMCCRTRWGGLEQEGFGIVFVEAAAAGVPQVAGASGGAAEAVADGVTGLVVHHPEDAEAVAIALAALIDDDGRRRRMGDNARERAVREFAYDALAARLGRALGVLPSS